MSRIGKMPILLPSGVTAEVKDGHIALNGPKGSLSYKLPADITVTTNDGELKVSRTNDTPSARSNHGLARSLIGNMAEGVSAGFSKKLQINGVGYRVQAQGQDLKFSLGYSHEVVYKVPAGVTVSVEQNTITVSGADKQQVGQAAAEIRSLKKPEPYKGKGIKYEDERIIRKSGKSGKE